MVIHYLSLDTGMNWVAIPCYRRAGMWIHVLECGHSQVYYCDTLANIAGCQECLQFRRITKSAAINPTGRTS